MNSKEYLLQIKHAKEKKHLLEMEIKRIREDITSLRAVDYSEPTVQSSNIADIADKIAKLEEAERKNAQEVVEASNLIDEIVAVIQQVEDGTLGKLLYYRYVQDKGWEEVAELIYYTTRSIHSHLHKQALLEIDKIRDKGNNGNISL